MKILTILGTRPEIIRLSRIIPLLDAAVCHVLVYTGQNYDPALSTLFFEELGIRRPDHHLGVSASTIGGQIAQILERSEAVMLQERPDRLLLLGDTNSALSAIVAKRLGIPVFHMEAGNRCYDDRVPEEINRRVIDHASDILMPYTERSRANLLREGIASQQILVTGNPIGEIIAHHADEIAASRALDMLGVSANGYLLATLHRAENVDRPDRLLAFLKAFSELSLAHGMPLILSTHPRTADRLAGLGATDLAGDVRFPPPFGFFDFVALEKNARCVLTDSGTVQEECCILKVPNVTLRDVTERPETVECGSNILTGADPEAILRAVQVVTATSASWIVPPEYQVPNVSSTVARILTGHHHHTTAR